MKISQSVFKYYTKNEQFNELIDLYKILKNL